MKTNFGEQITSHDQVAPRARRASSMRDLKPQTSHTPQPPASNGRVQAIPAGKHTPDRSQTYQRIREACTEAHTPQTPARLRSIMANPAHNAQRQPQGILPGSARDYPKETNIQFQRGSAGNSIQQQIGRIGEAPPRKSQQQTLARMWGEVQPLKPHPVLARYNPRKTSSRP